MGSSCFRRCTAVFGRRFPQCVRPCCWSRHDHRYSGGEHCHDNCCPWNGERGTQPRYGWYRCSQYCGQRGTPCGAVSSTRLRREHATTEHAASEPILTNDALLTKKGTESKQWQH